MTHTIENDALRVAIDETGAQLAHIVRKDTGREYLWQGDPAIWRGRAPLLFPFVGRLKGNVYRHAGNIYRMAKHGFVRGSAFALTARQPDRAIFTLESGAFYESYPFDFRLTVDYALEGECLKVMHRVENTGAETMFFSLGAHPGFLCDMGDRLFFPDDETACAYMLTEDGLRTEAPVSRAVTAHEMTITPDTFCKDALIFDGLRSDSVILRSGGRDVVKVDFGGAPCLGVWAMAGAPYVCIEPWYGVDDAASATGVLSEKKHIERLEPGCCFRFPMRIYPYA